MTISRIVSCLFTLVPALAGGSSADDANPDAAESHEPIVHEAGTVVEFHRKCADAEPYRVEAYAALHSEGDRARALATIYARRDAVRREEVFLGMRIVALQLQAGPEWANAPYAIHLTAQASERQVTGPDHPTYSANPEPGMGEQRAFRADNDGRMAWLDFVEPTEPERETNRAYNWSPMLETTATELGLDESDRRVLLGLTLTHGETGEEIPLTGPALRVPDRVWHQVPPKPRRLGLLATLNPFDKGSVWAALGNAARYGHCIDERRYAKRWFRDIPSTES
ncbi:MAG: hypothetical protein OXT64_05790 [Gammaproteobacteria bacterium]|nr:hypothetical protein [Gammaproteobacteria bacterium]MDE0451199.1 hypothetical protein [Gammaproteobacteria bacterium]